MSVESLTPRVREALGVSSSYDAETIPAAIRRAMKRLLRDYHFPKSVQARTWSTSATELDDMLSLNQQIFPLPKGFKKDMTLYYVAPGFNPPKTTTYSEPLKKLEGFRLPNSGDWRAKYYWLQGENFIIDKSLVEMPLEAVGLSLIYESWDVSLNEKWLSEDFEDVVYILTVYRTAAEMRKPEVMKAYAALWQEEMTSIAIYMNELEYDNTYIMQREAQYIHSERYPI